MDFTPTDEQRMAVESIRRFLDEKLEPEIRAHGECFIERPLMQKWTSELAAFGHISAPHREEWGGLDMGWLTHLLIFEEIAYSSLDVAIPGFINAVGAELIRRSASQGIQQRYLPGLVAGELFDRETVERQVVIECPDHPVAPGPDPTPAVGLISIRVGVTRQVEP